MGSLVRNQYRVPFPEHPGIQYFGVFLCLEPLSYPVFWVILHVPDYMLCAVGIDLVFLSPYASAHMPALLLTSFIWALSFGLLGNCLSGLPASFVALARMAGSFAVFLPFVRKAPLSHAVGMMGIGAVQFGGMYLSISLPSTICLPTRLPFLQPPRRFMWF